MTQSIEKRVKFKASVSYHQLFLEDLSVEHDYTEIDWDRSEVGTLPGLIAIRTTRTQSRVPVTVEILANAPADENLKEWDHVVECGIEVKSGVLSLTELFDAGNSASVELPPGMYHARVYCGALDSLVSDGTDMKGKDRYKIALWPGEYTKPLHTILKQWRR